MFGNTEKTGASRPHIHRNLQDVDALEEMKPMWQLGPAVANENDTCAWQLTEFRRDACDNSLGLGCVFDARQESFQTNPELPVNPRRAAKMSRIKQILSSTCLAASLLITVASSGCAGRVRVYDEYHSDWHSWDHNEELAYRRYHDERHEPYRDYNKLSKDDQKNYWNWRHDHSDPDKH